jgi:hypothetical protein
MAVPEKKQVHQYWETGDFHRVGEILFWGVDRKQLGYALSSIAIKMADEDALVFDREFLVVVAEENEWLKMCTLFHQLRAKTLRVEKDGEGNSLAGALLLFQENVAKHLCNLVPNAKRFDDDSGKWAVICLAHVLSALDTPLSIALRNLFIDTAMG